MAEETTVVEEAKPENVVVKDPFDTDSWKTEPTIKEIAPVVEEKKEEIVEEKKEVAPEVKPVVEEDPIVEEKVITPEPIKFANEDSERVYKLLLEGKTDEVLSAYSEQKKLAEADKLSPAEQIKLNLQYQNKDFSAKEVEDLFNDTYEMPDKPVQGELEDEEDFKARNEKYEKAVEKIQNRIVRDAKPALNALQKLQKEIVLPEISQRQEATEKEPTQEELEARKKEVDLFLKTVDENLATFNGYNASFKDEEVEIPIAYQMTKEEKAEIQPLIALAELDAAAFFDSVGWVKEGKLNIAKLAEDLPLIMDKQKVLNKMVSETGNRRIAEAIKSTKNIDYSNRNNGDGLGKTPAQMQENMADTFFSN